MNKLLKHSLLIGITASNSFPNVFSLSAAEKPKNPNIILIFMDDMGYGDLSCYGATQYKTPNLDKMASKGIRFTNFVSAQAVCSASRTGIIIRMLSKPR